MPPESSAAGANSTPEFPAGLDWLNTDGPLTLAQLRGKVVILDFWTYGCINCMHVIPDLKRLEKEYPNELVVIGVHSAKFANESDTENIRRIILRYGLEHPVVNDRDFKVWRAWGVQAWPTLFIIDPAGKVVSRYSGEGVYHVFKPIVQSLTKHSENSGLLRLTKDTESRGIPIVQSLMKDTESSGIPIVQSLMKHSESNGIRFLKRMPLPPQGLQKSVPENALSFPGKILADEAGARLFIADTNHHRIVVADIASGEVLNAIGNGHAGFRDGDFREVTFDHPQGMVLAGDGQTLYVADTGNHAVRVANLLTEEVSTLVGLGFQADWYPREGSVAPDVALNSPWDLELAGDQLYIAMAGAHQIWAMDLSSKMIGPLAGSGREGTKDGPLADAELAQPSGLTLDGKGRLYFADSEGSSIRWADISRSNVRVVTLVGSGASLFDFGDIDGVGRDARLQHPLGLVYYENMLYVADTYNSKIKRVDPETKEVRTFLGYSHGWRDGNAPLFYEPGGIDAAGGKLYVADTNNHVIRVIDLETEETSTMVLKGLERFILPKP